jgi:hypothetical protein
MGFTVNSSNVLCERIKTIFLFFRWYNSANIPVLLTRGISSLPDYGSIPHYCQPPDDMDPPTEPIINGPAVAFMTSFTRLLCSVMNVHKGIAQQVSNGTSWFIIITNNNQLYLKFYVFIIDANCGHNILKSLVKTGLPFTRSNHLQRHRFGWKSSGIRKK